MFTGLIADLGKVRSLRRVPAGAVLEVGTSMDLGAVAIGDSVAVDGVCLTAVVVDAAAGSFAAELSAETLRRTTLGEASAGNLVNLELALRLGDRLGGHMVQGHVDGVGRLLARRAVGAGWELEYEIPEALCNQVVPKGSIALDGVSLTVASLRGRRVGVAVIPHTADHTNLLQRATGAGVNVETDIIGKYVAQATAPYASADSKGAQGLSAERMRELGF